MNERIKELAEQAGYTPLPGFDFANGLQEVFLKKFAKLIAAECAKVCRNQPNIYAMRLDRENCAIAIEEYFGVEE